eukprot:TRINITY_DN17281_c0_g1_i1.p1 TRINITY_DN17281_c0_g1~~TRINITY_DN17281_c0_g1_i1.p1  ORF type:complete len:1063 (+),score=377.45 TRINITY_DN17281_c0_g1_i1:245-3433(+)
MSTGFLMGMFDNIDEDIDILVDVDGKQMPKAEADKIRNDQAVKKKAEEEAEEKARRLREETARVNAEMKKKEDALRAKREEEARQEAKEKAKEKKAAKKKAKKEAEIVRKKQLEEKQAEIARKKAEKEKKLAEEKVKRDKKIAEEKEKKEKAAAETRKLKEAEDKRKAKEAKRIAAEKKIKAAEEAEKLRKINAELAEKNAIIEAENKLIAKKKGCNGPCTLPVDWTMEPEELFTRYSVFMDRNGDDIVFVCPHADCKVDKPFSSINDLVKHHSDTHHSWLCGCLGEGSQCSNVEEIWDHFGEHVLGFTSSKLKKVHKEGHSAFKLKPKAETRINKAMFENYGKDVFKCPICGKRCDEFSEFLQHCTDKDFKEEHSWLALMHLNTLMLHIGVGRPPFFALPLRYPLLPESSGVFSGEYGCAYWNDKMMDDDESDEEIIGEIRSNQGFDCPICPNHESLPLDINEMSAHIQKHLELKNGKKNKCFICGTRYYKPSEHDMTQCFLKHSHVSRFRCNRCGNVGAKEDITNVQAFADHCITHMRDHMMSKDIILDSDETRDMYTSGHSKRNMKSSFDQKKQMHDACRPVLDMLGDFRAARKAAGNDTLVNTSTSISPVPQRLPAAKLPKSQTISSLPTSNGKSSVAELKKSISLNAEQRAANKRQREFERQNRLSGVSTWILPKEPFKEYIIPSGEVTSAPKFDVMRQKHSPSLFCPVCSVGVGQGFEMLTEHFIVHHNDEPCFLKCPFCSSLFDDSIEMHKHVIDKHRTNPQRFPFAVKCNFCRKSFKSPFKYLEHSLQDSHVMNHSIAGCIDACSMVETVLKSHVVIEEDDNEENEEEILKQEQLLQKQLQEAEEAERKALEIQQKEQIRIEEEKGEQLRIQIAEEKKAAEETQRLIEEAKLKHEAEIARKLELEEKIAKQQARLKQEEKEARELKAQHDIEAEKLRQHQQFLAEEQQKEQQEKAHKEAEAEKVRQLLAKLDLSSESEDEIDFENMGTLEFVRPTEDIDADEENIISSMRNTFKDEAEEIEYWKTKYYSLQEQIQAMKAMLTKRGIKVETMPTM